ncbi:MAG TPA: ATP-binding protein [Thermomicrobiales bacterium]|nr:ATP-binding protein [Thermomicrobiales bacterium]
MSIRTRLAIAVALVMVGTFVLSGMVLVRSTRATLIHQVDDQVKANADRYRGGGGGGKKDSPPDSPSPGDQGNQSAQLVSYTFSPPDDGKPYYSVVARLSYDREGRLTDAPEPCGFSDDPKPLPYVPPIPSDEIDQLVNKITTTPAVDGSLDYRMLVRRQSDGDYEITAASLESVDAAVARLIRILLLVGAIALAAATLGCWWLIRRGMRPVDRMVDTASAIAAGDLSRRVPNFDPRTELGRLGGALNEMLGQIEDSIRVRAASEERLRRFIADAAHELRTPLTSLRGYAELYRQGALPDEAGVANAMGRIEAEGGRMARLVDDMLLLARLDQQRGLETKPVDVVAVVREAVDDFRVVAPDRPLTTDLVESAVVRGDRLRLRQVIDNFLTNTRIHTPAGTPIHVGVARRGSQVEISIADQGPGIPAEDQARVFERFWRADPARVRSRGGTGLGLAIVASLVQAHGGSVGVASEPGRGATFTVRLPLIAEGAGGGAN